MTGTHQLLLIAKSLRERGQLEEATAAYQSILEQDPHHWEALNSIAALAVQAGDFERAVKLYDDFVDFIPDHAEAYYKRGNALRSLGRLEDALVDYDRAIAIDAGHGHAHCNRGFVLENLQRLAEALESYDRAIELDGDDFVAHYNRGTVLKSLERREEALRSYDRAIALNSDYAEAYVNRGNVLQEMQMFDAAVASYGKAIDLKPIFAPAFQGRATSLLALKRFESAILDFNQTLALSPRQQFILGARRHAQMHVCDWGGITEDLVRLTEGLDHRSAICPPHTLLALIDQPNLHRIAAEVWVRSECPSNAALGIKFSRRGNDKKIRVGYFSADFRDHAVSLLAAPIFELHDRSKFEITAFAFGPEVKDSMRGRLERAFDRFLVVQGQSDLEVASLARNLGIDIAVDLGGFTEHSRTNIFALRAAPIQISYLGYPGTMGAQYIDYLIADPTVVPASLRHCYAEKIAYLPGCYLPCEPMAKLPDTHRAREDLGLPRTGFVFCCFNNSYKIMPDTFDSWIRILRRVENSVLWLAQSNPAAVDNLRRETSRRGIDAGRLIFAKRTPSIVEHLTRIRSADLFLDTFPYTAHATALDALSAGLPVLTRCGDSFAARVAASVSNVLGLPELIAVSSEQYESVAVDLATKPEKLAVMKEKLLSNRIGSTLFDVRSYTAHLEVAYAQMFERYCSGLPPDHIYVAA